MEENKVEEVMDQVNVGNAAEATTSKPKDKAKLFDALSIEDKLKLEIAEELGLLEKVRENGWKSLSAKETGKIGGMMTKRKREIKKKQEAEAQAAAEAEAQA